MNLPAIPESPELTRKREEAIQRAGTKWLLHPANYVRRKLPQPRRTK